MIDIMKHDISNAGEMAHLVAGNSVESVFSRFKSVTEGKREFMAGRMGSLQNEHISRQAIHTRSVRPPKPDNKPVGTLETLRMGNDRVRRTDNDGRIGGFGGLIKGLGQGSPYHATPAQGAMGKHGAIPRKPVEIGGIHGLMIGYLGTIPAVDDTRGHTAKDFVKILYGHQDNMSSAESGEFDMKFAHGKDKLQVGSEIYPTRWYVVKSSSPMGKNNWKREFERPVDLQAGEYQVFENPEHTLKDTDVNMFVKLMWVGMSGEEVSAKQQAAQDAADKLAKAKADAETAIAAARSAVTTYKTAGGDTSGYDKSLSSADTAYGKGDYATATNTGKSVAIDAQNAYGLLQKQNLEKQKASIYSDPTLDAATKQRMANDIDNQKALVDQNTSSKIAQTQAQTPGTAMPLIPGMPSWVTYAVFGGIFAGLIGGIAYMAAKKR